MIKDIEDQFDQIALKSRHLFNQPVIVAKDTSPLGTYIKPTLGKKSIFQVIDIDIDIISKITRLLFAHDQLREDIFKYQKEKSIICPSIIFPELIDLSDIKEYQTMFDRLNKLLKDTYSSPESERRGCVDWVEIDNYNKNHSDSFGITLNNILQDIHTLSIDILHEYNMISSQYTSSTGIDETKILYFNIGSVRIINIEPYNIPKQIIDFINAFNEEIISSEYATYLNILYIKSDKKYRIDITLGAAFDHRSLIVYDPNPSIENFDHIYIDGNYTRAVAWKRYLSDFSENIEKEQIYIIDKGNDIKESISEEGKINILEKSKSLAWKGSFLKVKVPKEFLLDIVMIIYLINWDGVINHSSIRDIMSVEDEANIIYTYGLSASYDENKKRFLPRYKKDIQNILRTAIRETASGIENYLLPEKD